MPLAQKTITAATMIKQLQLTTAATLLISGNRVCPQGSQKFDRLFLFNCSLETRTNKKKIALC